MLDESRIKLMTRMASYEDTEGKKTIPIGEYFRGDYVSVNVVKTAISATIAFVLVLAVYIYYNLENFVADIYKFDLVGMGRRIVSVYIVYIAVFTVFAFFFYTIKYNRAKKSLQGYSLALKKLSTMYEEEE